MARLVGLVVRMGWVDIVADGFEVVVGRSVAVDVSFGAKYLCLKYFFVFGPGGICWLLVFDCAKVNDSKRFELL